MPTHIYTLIDIMKRKKRKEKKRKKKKRKKKHGWKSYFSTLEDQRV